MRILVLTMPNRSLLIAIVLFVSSSAAAHDSWISHNQWHNPAGEWCCGTGDCGQVLDPEHAVSTGPDGYHVNGQVQIDGASPEGNTTVTVHTAIPYSQKLPSPDGQFWYCKRPDGTPRCFFAPLPTY
jgi:hypothetical protein